MTHQGTLYYNEDAGSFDETVFSRISERGRAAGYDLVRISPELQMAEDIRQRIDRGYKRFIVGGGDGSIHHAIQALANTGATLGILPIGTFNHLARDLGIPLDPLEALKVALEGDVRAIDAGLVNGRYFVNNMLLGIYPEIVRHRESLRRSYPKWLAYWKATRYALERFPHVAVQVETDHQMEIVKTHVLAIAVDEYEMQTAGVLVPKRSFDSGVLTVYWIPYRPKWSYVPTLARYLRGSIRPGDEFRSLATRSVKISNARGALRAGMDGELIDLTSPFQVSVVPGALRVRR